MKQLNELKEKILMFSQKIKITDRTNKKSVVECEQLQDRYFACDWCGKVFSAKQMPDQCPFCGRSHSDQVTDLESGVTYGGKTVLRIATAAETTASNREKSEKKDERNGNGKVVLVVMGRTEDFSDLGE